MLSKVAIIISPNWKDYAKKYLAECLNSIYSQELDCNSKIFLIDNETSEASFSYLKNLAPQAEILRNKSNDGFAKGNNEAIKIALKQNFDYIILINMDTIVAPYSLQRLIDTVQEEKIGAVQARLMLWPNKEKINSIGNATHFLGFGYSLGYQKQYQQQLKIKKQIAYPSGAGVIFKAKILKEIGLFDEEFWMYNEDQDLGWRIWLAGYQCIIEPRAIIYHKYEFNRSIKKYYWMDRNRILVILKNYKLLSLILIFPAFVMMEIGLLFFALIKGWWSEKIKVYHYFLKLQTWKYLLNARRDIQKLRQTDDRNIIKLFTGKIMYQELDSPFLRIANIFFQVYWKIVSFLIFW